MTAISEAELNPFFNRYDLPSPKIAIQAHGAMAAIMAAASSDLLAMLRQQCLDFARRAGLLELVPIEETFEAPALFTMYPKTAVRSALPVRNGQCR